jgi:transglutaminase-like putative cysteine protease
MEVMEASGSVRAVLQTLKTIEYQYAEPVREVETQLRLFPLARRGAQRLLSRECKVWPEPDATRRFTDDFGNEVWEFRHAAAERLRFAIDLVTEHAGADRGVKGTVRRGVARLRASDGVPAGGVTAFLSRSPLVDDSEELSSAARTLAPVGGSEVARVEAIGQWVHEAMRFEAGVTTVETPASEALAHRRGVCQDYAHVMLAICRSCGLPARYVSGFIPGEGYMHAWVELLIRQGTARTAHWVGFDPTHNRHADAHYVSIAVGRDYSDVSPVTGSFYGSAPGCLTSWSKTVLQGPAA